MERDRWNGDALKVRRVHAGMRLEDLARRLQRHHITVDASTINRWERRSRPHDEERVARALAKIFGCSQVAFYRTPIVTFDPDERQAGEDTDDSSEPW